MAVVWIILTQTVLAYMCTGRLDNVALNRPASMSSRYRTVNAENAVDGNTIAVFPSTIHTDVNQTFAWWMVDLQTQVQDATVKIYFRTDYTLRRNGVKLYTSTNNITYPPSGGTPCHTFTNPVPDIDSVNCPGSWRYLMVHTTTLDKGIAILDFGEVEVLVCSSGTYGNNCTKSCSSHHCSVSSTSCDRYTGACPSGGCQAGWMGTDCTQACSSEKYGRNCSQLCNSRHCMETSPSCNQSTGACYGGCLSGWMGIDCTQECTSGSYGPECTMSCNSRKCTDPTSCDFVTGLCDRGCLPGWNGTDCTKQCSGGTYGNSCGQLCEIRHCLVQSDTCDHVTGACSVDGCKSGWNGTDCTHACTLGTYGANCVKSCSERQCRTPSSSCDWETGQCPDGCQDGWSGVDCTDHAASPDTDLDKLTVGVIGALIGIIVAIAVGAMVHICLVRHGRIEWKKPENCKQFAEMSDLSNRHGSSRTAAENPKSNTAHVYNNDYSVLDSTTKSENRVYDVLHDKDKDNQNM